MNNRPIVKPNISLQNLKIDRDNEIKELQQLSSKIKTSINQKKSEELKYGFNQQLEGEKQRRLRCISLDTFKNKQLLRKHRIKFLNKDQYIKKKENNNKFKRIQRENTKPQQESQNLDDPDSYKASPVKQSEEIQNKKFFSNNYDSLFYGDKRNRGVFYYPHLHQFIEEDPPSTNSQMLDIQNISDDQLNASKQATRTNFNQILGNSAVANFDQNYSQLDKIINQYEYLQKEQSPITVLQKSLSEKNMLPRQLGLVRAFGKEKQFSSRQK